MPSVKEFQTLKLNVLFHGTFAFVEEGQQIRALIPRIPGHSNRAGNWLGETEMLGGNTYRLEGVEPCMTGCFARAHNLFINSRETPQEAKPYLTLLFPRPAKITSLRTAKVSRNSFHDPAKDLKVATTSPSSSVTATDSPAHSGSPAEQDKLANQPSDEEPITIATLQIFTYDLKDEATVNQLRLATPDGAGGHYWEPVIQRRPQIAGLAVVNLHIFCTEDHHDEPHQVHDFNQCTELVGAQVKLLAGSAYQSGRIEEKDLPDGVVAQETEDLALRTQRMARLGRLVTEDGEPKQAWYKNDALDDGTPYCGDFIMGEPCGL